MGRQREEQTPVYGPEGIHAQVAALAATLVSTLLSIGVLLGIEAQQQGRLPREAGSRLTALTRLGVVLTAAATFYFFCLAWRQKQEHPGSRAHRWLLFANLLSLGAVLIKLGVTYSSQGQTAEDIEEAVE
ncbi:MAG TPA: hypothetical protein H9666_06150 [Firmicutes bacterium]|nr:hypothetical protein [Bacillota bacterium]